MSAKFYQHIGDDQFVHGMPKHMESGAGQRGIFAEARPKQWDDRCYPSHRVRQRPIPSVNIHGSLQGCEAYAHEVFDAGQKITVTITNTGNIPSSAYIRVNNTMEHATRLLGYRQSETVPFTVFGDIIPWKVFIAYHAGDGCVLNYHIKG